MSDIQPLELSEEEKEAAALAFQDYLTKIEYQIYQMAGLSRYLMGAPTREEEIIGDPTTSGYALNNLLQAARVRYQKWEEEHEDR